MPGAVGQQHVQHVGPAWRGGDEVAAELAAGAMKWATTGSLSASRLIRRSITSAPAAALPPGMLR